MKRNEVRIVAGVWRSRRIRFPSRDDLRPSPDRVRETLFNWLGQDLTGYECLDLFAGSGALGFEAASRGARRVVMVEHGRAAYAALEENRAALDARQVELARRDALEFVRTDRSQYDVIFLDPPFSASWAEKLPALLEPRLAREGRVYYESAAGMQWPPGWEVMKQGHAGQVVFQLVARHTP
ncbi:MAG TPA: 16S rRNA (guanine(966)-N(2))-methyltransferase RsmD [Burkholderiales bacterium]|nr:16S rRNA (guanine(966)-N(2))-methyltransferase RsmD [Burkholderiales bacterium]